MRWRQRVGRWRPDHQLGFHRCRGREARPTPVGRTAEGPCLDAVRTGQASFLDSMALAQRWPTFTPLAFAEGIIGLYSFPLKVGEETIGALNLHSRSRPLAFPDLRAASALAVQAAVTLANARAYDEARSRVAQLERALAARVADVRTRSVVRGRQC